MSIKIRTGAESVEMERDFSLRRRLVDFVLLTKPRVMTLVLFTGIAAIVVEGSRLSDPASMLLVVLGLYLTGGSANAFNQYFEVDVDSRMTRTSRKRPLPDGRLRPAHALLFAIAIGLAGVALFTLAFNLLAGVLSLATIIFYSFIYTLLLKPNTHLNIVIGGAAGAMAPVIAWAAVSGSVAATPLLMALIVFLWTPPHFWALALSFREDYEKSGLPMLPVVKGVDSTLRQMLAYSIALAVASVLPALTGAQVIYLAPAVALGAMFIWKTALAARSFSRDSSWRVFRFSLSYLFLLFAIMIADSLVSRGL